jgi:hypothetical protein
LEILMAAHHARSVLAALTVAAALTATGCTAGSGTASASHDDAGSPSHAPGKIDSQGSHDDSPNSPASGPTPSKNADAPGTSGSGSADSRGAPGSSGWCTTQALSYGLKAGHPGAGQRYGTLVLTNSSATACRTQGWPGLQLTDSGGGRIPTHVVRDRSRPARQLTLAPGEQATARLHWTAVPGQGDPGDGDCPDPKAVRVIPPDQRTAESARWSLGEVCGAGRIDVLPLG